MLFEDGSPKARQIDKLSAAVETVCCDWRRMRWIIERISRTPWWDLHTLCCMYCRAPFDVSTSECEHEIDCVYQRCCQIVGVRPLPLPNQAVIDEWRDAEQDPTRSATHGQTRSAADGVTRPVAEPPQAQPNGASSAVGTPARAGDS